MSNPSTLFRTPSTSARPLRGPTPQNVGTGVLDALGNVSDANEDDNESGSGSVGTDVNAGTNAPFVVVSGQRGKFVRETDVPDSAMLDIDVCLRKGNYGVEGDRAFNKNMEMATVALHPKFGVAKHRIVTRFSDTDEDNQTKFQHVQESIVSILHRVKEGHTRSIRMDFMDICTIADMTGNTSSTDPADWWNQSETNIWEDWDLLSDTQVRAWQYSVNKRFSDEDRVASRWLQSFVHNSSTDELRSAAHKKYDKLPKNQRGGVIYLYYTLTSMFTMSRDIKQAMLNYLDYFKNQGLAKVVRNENVLQAEAEIVGVCKRLDAAGALHEDVIIDILTGLSITSVSDFRKMFDTMLQNAKFGNYSLLPGVTNMSTTMEIIEAIFSQATDYYDKMNHSNKWNVANKGGGAGGGSGSGGSRHLTNACFNCEEQDCNLRICKKPKDDRRIEKNKKAYHDKKVSRENGNRGGSNGGGSNRYGNYKGNNGGKEEKVGPESQRKKWDNQGLHLVNGELMLHCKTCGYNDTHGSGGHVKWQSNPNKKHNGLERERALLACKGTEGATPPPTSVSDQSTLTGTSGGTTLTFSRASLEQRFSSFERNSTDPNAANIAAAMRSMFLN